MKIGFGYDAHRFDENRPLILGGITIPYHLGLLGHSDADVLIHEATFSHHMREKAVDHFHSTEIQAMEIADKSNVQRLILTHFSPRLTDRDIREWTWN